MNNIHLVGTSHLLPLRALAQQGVFDPRRECRWYHLSNSEYGEGEFVWTKKGVSHTSKIVMERWMASSGRTYVPVAHNDTVVAFGFDDRIGRYGFLAGEADHVSSACRAQTIRDIIDSSSAFRLVAMLRRKRPRVRIMIMEPPLLSRSRQVEKSGDKLVLKHRFHELSEQHALAAKAYGAGYMAQPAETLHVEGDYIYTHDDFLAPDGFHWGARGIDVVRRDLGRLWAREPLKETLKSVAHSALAVRSASLSALGSGFKTVVRLRERHWLPFIERR